MKKIGLPDNIAAETAQEIKKTENYLAKLKKLQASLEIAPTATESNPKPCKYTRKGKATHKPRNGHREAAKGLPVETVEGYTMLKSTSKALVA